MNSKKIRETVPRLKLLDETQLDIINKAIDSCIIVQSLKNMEKGEMKNFKKIES
ncbi:hypothetical protein NRP93_003588 [Clostridium botulinum]|nr:hypothetical protein [Clostridium botulinum]